MTSKYAIRIGSKVTSVDCDESLIDKARDKNIKLADALACGINQLTGYHDQLEKEERAAEEARRKAAEEAEKERLTQEAKLALQLPIKNELSQLGEELKKIREETKQKVNSLVFRLSTSHCKSHQAEAAIRTYEERWRDTLREELSSNQRYVDVQTRILKLFDELEAMGATYDDCTIEVLR
jgi:chromosome segregation ATPase